MKLHFDDFAYCYDEMKGVERNEHEEKTHEADLGDLARRSLKPTCNTIS